MGNVKKKSKQKVVAIYLISYDNDTNILDKQKLQVKEYCQKHKYKVYKVYTDKNNNDDITNRPKFNKMLEDLENDSFENIIAFTVKTITKNKEELLDFLETINQYDCVVEFALENNNVNVGIKNIQSGL